MEAEYVTVSSGFILGERVHPKPNPHSKSAMAAISWLQAPTSTGMGHVTGFNVSVV